MTTDLPDYLPLSFLNDLVFCPRRFWLKFSQGEMEVNAALLDGTLRHQRAHQPGTQTDERGRALRSVYLWSDELRVSGFADFVQEQDELLIPLEHKRGRKGKWANDRVQLCAQAICLEERTGRVVPHGEIFYWASRRRETVTFDDELRALTRDTAARAFQLLAQGRLPYPLDHPAKCKECSLEPICMPRETLQLLQEDDA